MCLCQWDLAFWLLVCNSYLNSPGLNHLCLCMRHWNSLDEDMSLLSLCSSTGLSMMGNPRPTDGYEGCPSAVSPTRTRHLTVTHCQTCKQGGFRNGNLEVSVAAHLGCMGGFCPCVFPFPQSEKETGSLGPRPLLRLV